MSMPLDVERLALLGWRLAPTTRSRKGMFAGYIDAATADLEQLERWAHAYPGCNWTVVPEGSGVFALDVDVPGEFHADDGAAAVRKWTEQYGSLPRRPHGRSGGGGHLLVFRDTGARICTGSGKVARGVDPKARRCAFTVAPSIHRSGNPYYWAIAPWDVAPPPAPQWLLNLLAPPPEPAREPVAFAVTCERAATKLRRAVLAVISAGGGTRNDTLNKQSYAVAGYVAAGVLPETEAVRALYSAARDAGLEHHEARATIRSGFTRGLRRPIGAEA